MYYKVIGLLTISALSCASAEHFSGFNISAGVGISAHNSNPIFESHRLTSSDAVADDIVDDDKLDVNPSTDTRVLSRTFSNKFSRNKSRLFEGNLSVGYGKVFKDKIYTGLSLTLDMTKNSKKVKNDTPQVDSTNDLYPTFVYSSNATDGNFGNITHKVRGINPTLVVKFGLICQKLNAVFYGRVGVRHVSSKLISQHGGSLKLSRFTPVLGFGFEKYLQRCPNTFIRFEGDYYLKTKKSGHLKRNFVAGGSYEKILLTTAMLAVFSSYIDKAEASTTADRMAAARAYAAQLAAQKRSTTMTVPTSATIPASTLPAPQKSADPLPHQERPISTNTITSKTIPSAAQS